MITKLDSLTDIATEFGTPLSTAGSISWYYNNKNPKSAVQPVMAGGGIKDWIGYNHAASGRIEIQLWYERANHSSFGRDFFRFFFTSSDGNKLIQNANSNTIRGITLEKFDGTKGITTYPQTSKLNQDYNYMMGVTGYPSVWQTDCRPWYNTATGATLDDITEHIDEYKCTIIGNLILDSTTGVYISPLYLTTIRKVLNWDSQ